ncbi:MAG TPA: hypothetical protein PL010_12100 [Flavobacteriales bacterium]|nr:hypothetical protein [Flavobacteriales bacterium]HNA32556.1 hypothetical protein [Flavobacteriales bacterium]HNE79751.1 hypothetical protein [Flavobacteriales bacterium]HNI05358.1 hypothetical protein [Flavobacteriales bacterium]HNK70302.1 hypothetical protein [Flavobacteriales bacterium]
METRLAFRLRHLTAQQRVELCAQLNVSDRTLYRIADHPGSMLTLEQADRLRQYLEAVDNCDYDMYQLLREVDITTA